MLNQLLLNSLIYGSIYALIALGFAVIYKTVRFFHFAHGDARRKNGIGCLKTLTNRTFQ